MSSNHKLKEEEVSATKIVEDSPINQLNRSIINYDQMKSVYTKPKSPAAQINEMYECSLPKSSLPDVFRLPPPPPKTSKLPKQCHDYNFFSSSPSSALIAPSNDFSLLSPVS